MRHENKKTTITKVDDTREARGITAPGLSLGDEARQRIAVLDHILLHTHVQLKNLLHTHVQFKNNFLTYMCNGVEECPRLRLIDFCITQLQA